MARTSELPGVDAYWVTMLTTRPGEKLECAVAAHTPADAIRKVASRKYIRENKSITTFHAKRGV